MFKIIDTQQLREKGASIKRRMEEILRSVREQQQLQQQQLQGKGQTGVRERIMYG
jgi:predicted ATP-grasp superfamily ATP-dependent carboligase